MIPERLIFAALLANQAAMLAVLSHLPQLTNEHRHQLDELHDKTLKLVDTIHHEWTPG